MLYLFCILSLILGGVIVYFILQPKIKKTQEYNLDIERLNNNLIDQKGQLENEAKQLQIELASLQAKRDEVQSSIFSLEQQAKESANIFYQKNMEIAQTNLDKSLENASNYYTAQTEQYQNDYKEMMADCAQSISNLINQKKIELEKLDLAIKEQSEKVNASVEASKRAEEIRSQSDFYKLIIPKEDLDEIKELREVEKHLRNPEPLNKVIWKCYYEKPTTDLIGRVIGSGTHTGIYKITNLTNQMCYVGQAANLAERWKQHIKRGLGADPVTKNKLYPAMKAIGVENFSFEVIEECERSKLDEREDYWQDFFKAKEFGYSIK